MWPIGPDPLVSTDMHEFYRSLAAEEDLLPTPLACSAPVEADSPIARADSDAIWQLARYLAWTVLGPSTALTTLCIALLEDTPLLDWKVALLALSSLIWLAPYVRLLLVPRRERQSSPEDRVNVPTWETIWH